MVIRILPTDVASQIAAGEVIERPASVVKELIENSLDAQAKRISIIVQDAGKSLIEVSDDGVGIPFNELSLAVERHATSKLATANDLFQIASLGFRGEALASIGSVSRMSITSRSSAAEIGGRVMVEGGAVFTPQAVGTPSGTLVRVEDLFFNVPARLKFLKKDATERRVIDHLVARYAMAYPEVSFQLQVDGRLIFSTSGGGDRREALSALFPPQIARTLLETDFRDQNIEIGGFISPTSLTNPSRKDIIFFVNGRPVQDSALTAALMKGYYSLLMVGRYPLAALFLQLPAENVDVNVHPTKAEVRFREPDRVFIAVQHAVRRTLLANNPVPGLQERLRWQEELGKQENHNPLGWGDQTANGRSPGWGRDSYPWAENRSVEAGEMGEELANPRQDQLPTSSQTALPGQRVPILRAVGQIAGAYLIAEGPDGLYLIDQHAAHERVLFERYQNQQAATPVQTLLQPVQVELSPAMVQAFEELLPTLQKIGYQIEPFGPTTYLVRSLPALFSGSDPASSLRSLVDQFDEDESAFQNQVEAKLIARICKRSAVKAGTTLSPEEQKNLVLDLENCRSPRTCPHGRPTMIHISVDLLERQFGRKGAR